MARVTLQTIADRLGVSRMTVSNAFSRPDQLSAALRDRILAVADQLGYSGPDPAGRTLSRGRSDTIGVLFTDTLSYAFSDEVATTFLSGVAGVLEDEGVEHGEPSLLDVLEDEGVGLTVLSTPRGDEMAGAVQRAVIDGLIVYSVDADSPGLKAARQRDLALAFVDQSPEAAVPSVNVDDRSGARAAAEHVIGLGHRRLGFVLNSAGLDTALVDLDIVPPHHVVAERLTGWREAAQAAALPRPLAAHVPVNGRAEGAAGAALILDAEPRITALLCLSDAMALGALDTLRLRGLRVPDDVSVVGFDDSRAAALADPPLTTVRQPVAEKGGTAAQLLLDALTRRDARAAAPASSIVLPTELVVRASTGPPPPSRRSP